jgi:hypothetical protein
VRTRIKAREVQGSLLIILLSFISFLCQSQTRPNIDSCIKCDIHRIYEINKNIHDLNDQKIKTFLCTFDSTCTNNAEFKEFSNEVLFNVVKIYPSLTLRILSMNISTIDLNTICNELENPIGDDININNIYNRVKELKCNTQIKNRVLNSLERAIQKSSKN